MALTRMTMNAEEITQKIQNKQNKPQVLYSLSKTIEDLFDGYDGDYKSEEIDWGEPVGDEIW